MEERAKGTRRMFLGLGLGCASGILAGFGLGGGRSSETDALAAAARESTPEWLAELAAGPLPTLFSSRQRYLHAVEAIPHADPLIWVGVTRIIDIAVDDPRHRPLGIQLLLFVERNDIPSWSNPWFGRLRDFVDSTK